MIRRVSLYCVSSRKNTFWSKRRGLCGSKKENGRRVEKLCKVKICVGCVVEQMLSYRNANKKLMQFFFVEYPDGKRSRWRLSSRWHYNTKRHPERIVCVCVCVCVCGCGFEGRVKKLI